MLGVKREGTAGSPKARAARVGTDDEAAAFSASMKAMAQQIAAGNLH